MILKIILSGITISAIAILGNIPVSASPYGVGLYNADVPYGGETQISLATNGSINIPITPTDNGTLGSGSGTVTVTSTDVVGYRLYIRALSSTNLTKVGGSAVLGASSNVTSLPLATNTWGYNLDASTNFIGPTATDQLLRTRTGPFKSGDVTTVTYGVKVDNTKPAGSYQTTVMYTAIPQTN
ncbi:MAG: hypothetical protein WAO28_01715 [Candidatus Microsaccharimonas sp.]